MLTEIIRVLTKAKECADITHEQVLGWGKKSRSPKSTVIIMDRLTETKEFDKIKIAKGGFKYNGQNVQTCAKVPAKKSCSYCSSKTMPSLWEEVCGLWQDQSLQRGMQKQGSTAVHNISRCQINVR